MTNKALHEAESEVANGCLIGGHNGSPTLRINRGIMPRDGQKKRNTRQDPFSVRDYPTAVHLMKHSVLDREILTIIYI